MRAENLVNYPLAHLIEKLVEKKLALTQVRHPRSFERIEEDCDHIIQEINRRERQWTLRDSSGNIAT